MRINEGKEVRVPMLGWMFAQAASLGADIGTNCVFFCFQVNAASF